MDANNNNNNNTESTTATETEAEPQQQQQQQQQQQSDAQRREPQSSTTPITTTAAAVLEPLDRNNYPVEFTSRNTPHNAAETTTTTGTGAGAGSAAVGTPHVTTSGNSPQPLVGTPPRPPSVQSRSRPPPLNDAMTATTAADNDHTTTTADNMSHASSKAAAAAAAAPQTLRQRTAQTKRAEEYTVEDQYSYLGPTSLLYKVRVDAAKDEVIRVKDAKPLPTANQQTLRDRINADERLLQLSYLTAMGLLSGFVAVVVAIAVHYLLQLRGLLMGLYGEWWYKYVIYIVYMQLLCVAAGLAVRYISRFCGGSGIPELKSILSGVSMPRYLSFRNLIAKLVGLTLAQGSGLPVGRIGPFVQISGMIGHQLASHVPYLRRVKRNYMLYLQMMAAAAATGVSAVIGAPIGGTLFSVEVTATFFVMNNLWKAFYSAICASLVYTFFKFTTGGTNFTPAFWSATPANATRVPPISNTGAYTLHEQEETLLLIAWGILAAVFGVLFVEAMKYYTMLRKRFVWWRTSIFVQAAVVAAVVALVQYPIGNFMTVGAFDSIKTLVSRDRSLIDASPNWLPYAARPGGTILNLAIFFIVRFALNVPTLLVPLPAGVIAPVMELGAIFGRLGGELMVLLFAGSAWAGAVNPGGYALVGSIAFACAATNTLSPAIIIFEATGDVAYLLPALVVSIAGLAISRATNNGIYDMMLRLRSLPYLAANFAPKYAGRLANELMLGTDDLDVVSVKYATCESVRALLRQPHCNHVSFPVVESTESMRLVGSIQRSALLGLLAKFPKAAHEPVRFFYQVQANRNTQPAVCEMQPTEPQPQPMPAYTQPHHDHHVHWWNTLHVPHSMSTVPLLDPDANNDIDQQQQQQQQQPQPQQPIVASNSRSHRLTATANTLPAGGDIEMQQFTDNEMAAAVAAAAAAAAESEDAAALRLHFNEQTPATGEEPDANSAAVGAAASGSGGGPEAETLHHQDVTVAVAALESAASTPVASGTYTPNRERSYRNLEEILNESTVQRARISTILRQRRLTGTSFASEQNLQVNEPIDTEMVRVSLDNREINERMPCVEYNPAPLSVPPLTSLAKIQYLFAMLGLSHVWVVDGGRLVGVITKKHIVDLAQAELF